MICRSCSWKSVEQTADLRFSRFHCSRDAHPHEEKQKPLGSFEDMVKDLDKQKQVREQMFAQEMNSHKDRGRLLEEKFQEAKKKAEKDTRIYRNPLDMD